jgi:hypothetical protein
MALLWWQYISGRCTLRRRRMRLRIDHYVAFRRFAAERSWKTAKGFVIHFEV